MSGQNQLWGLRPAIENGDVTDDLYYFRLATLGQRRDKLIAFGMVASADFCLNELMVSNGGCEFGHNRVANSTVADHDYRFEFVRGGAQELLLFASQGHLEFAIYERKRSR